MEQRVDVEQRVEQYLPQEIWLHIFQYINLRSISTMSCTNKFFNNFVESNKWVMVDNLVKRSLFDYLLVPKNYLTYKNFRYCVDLSFIIIKKLVVPEDIIEHSKNASDLEIICAYQQFSDSLLRKLFKHISIRNLLSHQQLPIDILDYIMTYNSPTSSDLYLLWSKQKVTLDFIMKYIDKVQWPVLSSNKDSITIDVILAYNDKLQWTELTKHGINEDILEKYIDRLDSICWSNISEFTKLSMPFIEKYVDKLDIYRILRFQDVSEEFLCNLIGTLEENFMMYFHIITLYQRFSLDFMLQYKHFMTLEILIRNKKLSRYDIMLYVDEAW